MGYSIAQIVEITGARLLQRSNDFVIDHLSYDSRSVTFPAAGLFFALRTGGADGHRYVADAHSKGVRAFVVEDDIDFTSLTDAWVLQVPDSLRALQLIARHHRRQYSIPVIGITGSNGKTVVKEWLYQLMHTDFSIVRSPRSYNSQIGVPISVWQISDAHNLGIFEAGISQPGEMQALADVMQPTIGVFTFLGDAHDQGFHSREQKFFEKLKLFRKTEVLIGPKAIINGRHPRTFTWGGEAGADVRITAQKNISEGTGLHFQFGKKEYQATVPFTDGASLHNACTCLTVMLYLGYDAPVAVERLKNLHPVDMRLQLKPGINQCTLINDSYSADIASLQIALQFLSAQRTGQKRTVLLSDFVSSGMAPQQLYAQIADSLKVHRIEKLVAVGSAIHHYLPLQLGEGFSYHPYNSTEALLQDLHRHPFFNEIILIKGARHFHFEDVVQHLQKRVHQTVLHINLNALANNLKSYRRLLQPGVKVMAMVKAFSYGSGSAEVASALQFQGIDYLGVAYADEGVELRRAGIHVPLMVMNGDPDAFTAIMQHNLEPVLYSVEIIKDFTAQLSAAGAQAYPVHVELETGMNRLGLHMDELTEAAALLKNPALKIQSVFTHLAASEEAAQDAFTAQQAEIFSEACTQLEETLGYSFIKHIANSAAIIRHPQQQLNMVRLGIGLYGIEISTNKLHLQPVATLRSTIAQIKHLKKGDSVSYNRRALMERDTTIATVRIGYADGYNRRFGSGAGKMLVRGALCPVVGTVCMDMTMIDVTDLPNVQVDDEVIIWGEGLPVQTVAAWIKTIPYELMTSVSQRVQREYYQE